MRGTCACLIVAWIHACKRVEKPFRKRESKGSSDILLQQFINTYNLITRYSQLTTLLTFNLSPSLKYPVITKGHEIYNAHLLNTLVGRSTFHEYAPVLLEFQSKCIHNDWRIVVVHWYVIEPIYLVIFNGQPGIMYTSSL